MHPVAVPLSEPVIVPDVYVTGLHDVEHLGEGDYRFIFYVKQKGPDGISEERLLVARMVMSTTGIFLACKRALKAIGLTCCGAFGQNGKMH